MVSKISNYYLCVKIICVNQERWCSGDSSHGQTSWFHRHRFYDIIYVDKGEGSIVVPRWNKRFNKEELTKSIIDFECEADSAWEIIRAPNNVLVKRE